MDVSFVGSVDYDVGVFLSVGDFFFVHEQNPHKKQCVGRE